MSDNRTFSQRMTNPSNAWQQSTFNSYATSMISAGQDPLKGLQRFTAQAKPVSNPILLDRSPRQRVKAKGKAAYRREWDRLSDREKYRQRGFDNFVARREVGLVSADGRPTK
jgi:hypothetical protein